MSKGGIRKRQNWRMKKRQMRKEHFRIWTEGNHIY